MDRRASADEEPLLAADARGDWASVPSIIKGEGALLCFPRRKNKNRRPDKSKSKMVARCRFAHCDFFHTETLKKSSAANPQRTVSVQGEAEDFMIAVGARCIIQPLE